MSRERYRDIWKTYLEVWESKMGAPALPCGEEVVDSTKVATGHGSWLDASIDFFHLAGKDMKTLHGMYYCSVADTRKPHTKHEKRIGRIFWQKVRERALDEYGVFISERM